LKEQASYFSIKGGGEAGNQDVESDALPLKLGGGRFRAAFGDFSGESGHLLDSGI
jgi:hypothetical protein